MHYKSFQNLANSKRGNNFKITYLISLFFLHRFKNKTKPNSTGKIWKRTLPSGQKKVYKNQLPDLQTKLPISYTAPEKENPKNERKWLTADHIVTQIILCKYSSLSNRTIPYTNKIERFFSPALQKHQRSSERISYSLPWTVNNCTPTFILSNCKPAVHCLQDSTGTAAQVSLGHTSIRQIRGHTVTAKATEIVWKVLGTCHCEATTPTFLFGLQRHWGPHSTRNWCILKTA